MTRPSPARPLVVAIARRARRTRARCLARRAPGGAGGVAAIAGLVAREPDPRPGVADCDACVVGLCGWAVRAGTRVPARRSRHRHHRTRLDLRGGLVHRHRRLLHRPDARRPEADAARQPEEDLVGRARRPRRRHAGGHRLVWRPRPRAGARSRRRRSPWWRRRSATASVCSQSGDLFESALKRRFGAKDSGQLDPRPWRLHGSARRLLRPSRSSPASDLAARRFAAA